MALQQRTDFCELDFFDRYAIMKTFENQIIDLEKVKKLQQLFVDHFKKNDFVLISDRRHQYEIDLSVYKGSNILSTLKGFAIVSNTPSERERALKEQTLFDNSFAFFESLEDAVHWANAFFRY